MAAACRWRRTAAEIILSQAAIAETLPNKVSIDTRLYQNDGEEAPMRLDSRADALLNRTPAGRYQLGLSRSGDPYNACISPIHAAGQQRTEHRRRTAPLGPHAMGTGPGRLVSGKNHQKSPRNLKVRQTPRDNQPGAAGSERIL